VFSSSTVNDQFPFFCEPPFGTIHSCDVPGRTTGKIYCPVFQIFFTDAGCEIMQGYKFRTGQCRMINLSNGSRTITASPEGFDCSLGVNSPQPATIINQWRQAVSGERSSKQDSWRPRRDNRATGTLIYRATHTVIAMNHIICTHFVAALVPAQRACHDNP
jgi:hypothetical protein